MKSTGESPSHPETSNGRGAGGNCVGARRGGEQPEANLRSQTEVNLIGSATMTSLLATGEVCCESGDLLQTLQSQRVERDRRVDPHETALHPQKTAWPQRSRPRKGSPTLAQSLLLESRSLLPAGRPRTRICQSPSGSKPLTGEPDAGDLHVRCGGGVRQSNAPSLPLSARTGSHPIPQYTSRWYRPVFFRAAT